jgi:hypothetical protein
MPSLRLASAAVLALVTASSTSRANDMFSLDPYSARHHTFVSAGPIGDVGGHLGHEAPGTGVVLAGGLELSVVNWPGSQPIIDDDRFAFGGFAQIEAAEHDGHARGALGLEANYLFVGAELGASLEQASGPYASSVGVHVAPYLTLGIIYVALRVEVPFAATSGGPTYGPGLAFVLGLKAPVPAD